MSWHLVKIYVMPLLQPRAAHAGWTKATAYNRGQILYRIAEMLEGRAEQVALELSAALSLNS
jgi:acyl-CoA reductase-like NAD-dependent aldehyde dehydrogenase